MLQKKQLTLAVRAALGLTTVVMSMPLFAQSSQNQLEEIVVTGSRIMKANLVTSSPVTQLDAEQLSMTGITRLEDVMKDLPQVYQSQGTKPGHGPVERRHRHRDDQSAQPRRQPYAGSGRRQADARRLADPGRRRR